MPTIVLAINEPLNRCTDPTVKIHIVKAVWPHPEIFWKFIIENVQSGI